MDSDFMSNLANMLKNGNIPDDMKSKMSRVFKSKRTDKILILQMIPTTLLLILI